MSKNPASNPNARAPKLEMRQGQNLVMSAQLRQAINLLQLNNLELEGFINQELESNPLLERVDGDITERDVEKDAKAEAALLKAATPQNDQWSQDNAPTNTESLPHNNNDAESFEPYDTLPSFNDGHSHGGDHNFEGPSQSWEDRMADVPSLFSHLSRQIELNFASPQDKMLAFALVDGLDECGYYRGSMAQIATQFDCDLSDVEMVLARCQTFDPAGIFAVNLAQCLELQLKDQEALTPQLSTMLAYLDLIGQGELKKLQQRCGVDDAAFKNMLALIRRLDPKPATKFQHDVAQTIIPDVLLRKNTDPTSHNHWMVELNPDSLPKVLMNERYRQVVETHGLKKEEKAFIQEKTQSAQWLIKALDQRAQTIIKVAAEIVRQQDAFFMYGIGYLKPLVLREVAATVGVHESTVSRVTAGKYIHTQRGVFELKFFFTSGVGQGQANSMAHAAHSVKARIKQLIDAEKADSVLSDDDITKLLKDEGVPIARRTVMKYREAHGLGSSVERRRQKAGR